MNAQIFLILVTAASSFVSCGFALNGFITNVQDQFAGYALARSIPLACAGGYLLLNRSAQIARVLAVIMIGVQLLDAMVGIKIHDTLKTFGPFLTASFNLTVLLLTLRKKNI